MNDVLNWNLILSDFEQSMGKESIQSFCSKNHISIQDLKKHYRMAQGSSIPVDVKSNLKKSYPYYMVIEVNGMKVKVNKDFDKELLVEVLSVLKSIC